MRLKSLTNVGNIIATKMSNDIFNKGSFVNF